MKKTRLLTSLSTLALVLSLGACEGDINISVGDAGTTAVEEKEYKISFESNGYVYAIGLPESADEGDKIEFVLAAQSGFRIEDVEGSYILDSRSQILDLEGDATGYSFVMPAADVSISAKGVGGYYSVSYDRNAEVFVTATTNYDSYKQLHFITGIYEQGTGEELGTSEKTFVQAGDEVMLVGKHQAEAENIKYYLDGEELEQITDPELNCGYYAFGFVMPNKDCEITVTGQERRFSLILEENTYSEYVDAYISSDTTGVSIYNTVRVHAALKQDAPERYASIKAVTLGADVYDNDCAATYSYQTVSLEGSGSSYSGSIPWDWSYVGNEITVSVDVEDLYIYEGYDFVGTWTGYEIWAGAKWGSQTAMTIDVAGNVTGAKSTKVESLSDDGLTLNLANKNPFNISKDAKVGITFYYDDNSNTNDVLVFANTTEDVTLVIDDIYLALEYAIDIFVGDDYYGSVYANSSLDGLIYAGVTFEFTDASESLQESVRANPSYQEFVVKDADGNVITTVTGDSYLTD